MNSYIKSPLNYVGGKHKILPQIMPYFPSNINTFVDLFGGGFNVGVNVNAKSVIFNDNNKQVVDLIKMLYILGAERALKEIDKIISKFQLSKTNQDGFCQLRDYYNNIDNNSIIFYTLICYAFNYQIRFNKQGKYNMPFGKNRSSFNPKLRNNFIKFCEALHTKDIIFSNESFDKVDLTSLTKEDFVYLDPPYYNAVATYNENGNWTEDNEKKLLNLLDSLNQRGIKFALSNNLKYENPFLDTWRKKYNTYFLDNDYSNCNYHKIDRSQDIEVLITNY